MKEEEIHKYIDDWFKISNKIAQIESVSAQLFAWHIEMSKMFRMIWQDGHDAGVIEGRKQKTSVVIKKLTEEN